METFKIHVESSDKDAKPVEEIECEGFFLAYFRYKDEKTPYSAGVTAKGSRNGLGWVSILSDESGEEVLNGAKAAVALKKLSEMAKAPDLAAMAELIKKDKDDDLL